MTIEEAAEKIDALCDELKASGFVFIFGARREGDGGWTRYSIPPNEFIALMYVLIRRYCGANFTKIREVLYTITSLALDEWGTGGTEDDGRKGNGRGTDFTGRLN